jgi:hypothetical protein
MAMDKYSKLELDFKGIGGAMRFTGQEAVSLQKQFRLLKQELTLGSYTEEQFNQIRNALQEVEIKLKQSQIRGKEFFEQIGTLGGPIGELSNRVSRAISLFAALNEMSFDELKSQFENISKILAGSVEDISAGISVVKTGGRAEGVREGTGNAGEAGDSLSKAEVINAAANVANADAITKVAEATKVKTSAELLDEAALQKLNQQTVLNNVTNSKYLYVTDEITARNAKLIYTEEEKIKQQQSLIGLSKSKKKALQEQYDAELVGANAAMKANDQWLATNEELLQAQSDLEIAIEGTNTIIADQSLWIEVTKGEYRKLNAEELALIATNEALVISTQGLIVTETANAEAIKKATLAKERAASINKVFNFFLNAGAAIANAYNGAVRLLATGFGIFTKQTIAATLAVQTFFLVIGAGIGLGIAALLVALKEMVTGFAATAAAAQNLKVQLENVNEILDLNLAAIKRRNAEEMAEMKKKNATSEELRQKDIKASKEGQIEIGKQLEEAKILEAKALGDFGPARKAIEDKFKQEKLLYKEGSDELLGARSLFLRDLAQLNFEQNNYEGGFFGLTEEAATQQADNIKKSGKLVLSLQEKQKDAVNEINVKGNADIEATTREGINNRIKAIDAEMEQQIDSTTTSSKELIRLYSERNRLVDYLDKDHKLTLVERAERTRIQNKKINDAIIEDDLRVIQSRINHTERQLNIVGKSTEEEFKLKRQLAAENLERETKEAEKDQKTKEENTKNAYIKFYKALKDIDISELSASEELKQTFLNGSIKDIESYFDAQVDLENASYKKRREEFEGNAKKLEALEKEHTQKLQDIEVQRLASREELAQHYLNGESENTKLFFQLERQLEDAAYTKQQAAAKGNYDLLEALRLEHLKKMEAIDAKEFENKAQMLERKSKTEYFDEENNGLKLKEVNQKIYDDKVASENAHFEAEKIKAGTNKEQLAQIDLEHNQTLAQIGAERIETEQQINLKIEEVTGQFGSVMSQLGNILLADAQGRDEKKFKQAKKMAIAGIGIEKAAAIASIWTNTYIANAKMKGQLGIFGIPLATLNTISAVLATAASIAAAAQAISAINGTDFQSPDKGSGRHYASGGMIDGPRHSNGGVPIEAEGGEAVMTRGAVTAFAPLLSMLNVAGGGTSFSQGAVGQAGFDFPSSNRQQISEQQITKTYVVEQELTTMQQRQSRLKDLSTI